MGRVSLAKFNLLIFDFHDDMICTTLLMFHLRTDMSAAREFCRQREISVYADIDPYHFNITTTDTALETFSKYPFSNDCIPTTTLHI